MCRRVSSSRSLQYGSEVQVVSLLRFLFFRTPLTRVGCAMIPRTTAVRRRMSWSLHDGLALTKHDFTKAMADFSPRSEMAFVIASTDVLRDAPLRPDTWPLADEAES